MELLLALIYTCIIEAAVTFVIICVYRIFSRRTIGKDRSTGNPRAVDRIPNKLPECDRPGYIMIYYNLLCNLLTNPVLNLGLYGAACLGAGLSLIRVLIIIGEICVVAAEYRLYRIMSHESRRLCLFLSLITNAASYLTGLLIM